MYTHNTHVPISHFRAWRLQKKFPLDATVKLLVTLTRWTPGSLGHDYWVRALGPITANGTKTVTVAECIAAGKKMGLTAYETQRHLAWLYTWGGDQVEIGGMRYVHTIDTPTLPAGTEVAATPAPAAPKAKKTEKAKASA